MQNNNNPLSPHLQIYKWQISSLLSITHRIVGVINIIAITLICIWTLSLLIGENSYEITQIILISPAKSGATPTLLLEFLHLTY